MVLLLWYSFKWQYMAGAGAGAGTEIMDKDGAEKLPEPKINKKNSSLQHWKKVSLLLDILVLMFYKLNTFLHCNKLTL